MTTSGKGALESIIGKYRTIEEIESWNWDTKGYRSYHAKLAEQRVCPTFLLKVFDADDMSIDEINRVIEHFRILSSINFPMVQNFFDCYAVDNPIRFA